MGAKGQQGQSMYYELGLEKREQLANRKEKKKKKPRTVGRKQAKQAL